MKTYEPARNVLAHAADFHKTLSVMYRDLTEQTDRERVRLLLDYLQRHEKNFEESLKRYSSQTRQRIRETWFQYIPKENELTTEDIELRPDMSIDDIVRAAMELDRRLAAFYRQMAAHGGSQEVRDIFSGLAQQEERERSKLAQTAYDIQHL